MRLTRFGFVVLVIIALALAARLAGMETGQTGSNPGTAASISMPR